MNRHLSLSVSALLILTGSVSWLSASGEDNTPSKLKYWFDNQTASSTLSLASGTYNLDATGLDDGFHTLCCQIVCKDGSLGPATSSFFLKVRTNEGSGFTPTAIRYWYDAQTVIHSAAYQENCIIDASMLDDGFHTLCYQVSDGQGHYSPVCSSFFLCVRTNGESGFTPRNIRYWFDSDAEIRTIDYQESCAIDATTLDEGFHTLCYQLSDGQGNLSPVRTTYFMRIIPAEREAGVPESIIYWVDDQYSLAMTVSYSEAVTLHDLEHLPEGEHTITYQVITDTGVRTPASSFAFMRVFYDLYIKNPMEFDIDVEEDMPVLADRPFIKLYYDEDTLKNVGHLHVDPSLNLSLGKYAQSIHLGNYNATNTSAYLNYSRHTSLINEGHMRADSVLIELSAYKDRWHFITLPFNVKVTDISIPDGVYWTIREYDGEERAHGNNDNTWKSLNAQSMIEANRGYILQFTKADNGSYYDYKSRTAKFVMRAVNDTKKNQIFASGDYSVALQEHIAEFAHNRSWNLVGNPYPSFYDTRMLESSNPITVWTGTTYKAVSPEDDAYVLAPFEAFFTQRPIDKYALIFQKEGRQDSPEAREMPAAAPRRTPRISNRQVFNLALSDTTVCDECRIVINDEALTTYEVENDAVKFMSDNATVPQIYSEHDGVQYAINERPLADGLVTLSLRIPVNDTYTIGLSSVRNANLPIYLIDQETQEVTNLEEGDYTFAANEGILNGRMVVSFGEVLGIDAIQDQLHGRIEIYNINGTRCYRGRKSLTELSLPAGVYIVRSKEATHKVIIK